MDMIGNLDQMKQTPFGDDGRLAWSMNELGRVTSRQYNPLTGRLARAVEDIDDDAALQLTSRNVADRKPAAAQPRKLGIAGREPCRAKPAPGIRPVCRRAGSRPR